MNSKIDSVWTIDALKEYFDTRLVAIDTAVTKAEDASNKRFEGVNEFRNTLSDQQRTFVPRAEYESALVALNNIVLELKTKIEKSENVKSGASVVWAYAITIGSLILATISTLLKFK